ncbi:MAG: ComEC/Rec2 family competence protein, partial [Chloroflexi bacterium]|nr:ComEC/Rec2 family competence protein [Chloroflexota bacterium]
MPLIFLAGAWVIGVFLGSRVGWPLAFLLIGLAPLPLLFFVTRRRYLIVWSSFCLLAFFGGAIYSAANLHSADWNSPQLYDGYGGTEIKGMVAGDPAVGDRATQIRLSTKEIKQAEGWRPHGGTVLLLVPRYPAYRYGDMLLVRGKLETPPQLGDFDYRGHLAQQGIHSVMYYPVIQVLERDRGFAPLGWIYSFRSRLSQIMAEVLPEPQASLAQGVILGIRGNIPSAVSEQFIHTGTAHLLAISGLHLSIVAGILLSLGIWLFGRRHYIYIWLALCAIWLYAILTGLQPPVVRAAIMVSVFLVADLLGRQRNSLAALALAGAIMVGITPQALWQASFQMSFM